MPAVAAMAVLFALGRYVCPWLFDLATVRGMTETFTAVLFVAVLGSAWVAYHVGVSMALGAFVIGVALSGTSHRHRLREEVIPFKNLLLGLFFVSVGLSIDVGVLRDHAGRILMHVLAIIAVKVAVLYLAARAIKMEHGSAARLSFLLGQAGEFGFVILGTLLVTGVVTHVQFANGIMVIALTTILTSWLDALGVACSRLSRPAMPSPRASAP
jgi:glutathione-regulated potassium-efflux system protein KefB